jgi:hypothetical protein
MHAVYVANGRAVAAVAPETAQRASTATRPGAARRTDVPTPGTSTPRSTTADRKPIIYPGVPSPASLRGSTGFRDAWGRLPRVGAVLAVGIAAAIVAWVLIDRSNNNSSQSSGVVTLPTVTTSGQVTRPSIRSVAELQTLAKTSAVPLYWAGDRAGTRLEFTRAPTGAIFVRYLPPGVAAGDLRPYLTIATYPTPHGFTEIQASAKSARTKTIHLAGGGLAVYDTSTPTNVHLAYPGQPYQIEVFAPGSGTATALVSNGAIRPIA